MSAYPQLIPQPVAPKYEALLAELPEHKRGQKDQLCRIYIEGKRADSTTLFGNNGPHLLQLLRWAESMGWDAAAKVRVFRYSKVAGTDSYLSDEFRVADMGAVASVPVAATLPIAKKVKPKASQGNLFEMEVPRD